MILCAAPLSSRINSWQYGVYSLFVPRANFIVQRKYSVDVSWLTSLEEEKKKSFFIATNNYILLGGRPVDPGLKQSGINGHVRARVPIGPALNI